MSSKALATTGAVLGGLAGTALVIWPLAIWLEVRKCEKPKYEVLRTIGDKLRAFYDRAPAIELRQYSPQLVAQVTVETNNMKDAMSKGFRQIAGFIFGNNEPRGGGAGEKVAMTSPVEIEAEDGEKIQSGKGEKVAMTSPVVAEMDEGRFIVKFIMPSKYTKDTLPRPKNSNVHITEVPAQVFAAISWRGGGRADEAIVAAKRRELEAALAGAGVAVPPAAPSRLFEYHPPFAPGWMRLHDVLVTVEGGAAALRAGTEASAAPAARKNK